MRRRSSRSRLPRGLDGETRRQKRGNEGRLRPGYLENSRVETEEVSLPGGPRQHKSRGHDVGRLR